MTALQDIPLKTIQGGAATLGDYAGKVLLVVNTASKCGLTPQYEGLQALYTRYAEQGLVVLGFPANDFAGQEPGSDAEIAAFCSTSYDVDFPMFAKLVATGPARHPLYSALIAAAPNAQGDTSAFRERLRGFGLVPTEAPEVLWNFEKFVIGRDGRVVARFAPDIPPSDATLLAAIDAALALPA